MPRRRVTVTLTIMPGAEPWVRVAHATGWFKIPAEASILEALAGALEGWTATARRAHLSVPSVRVPLTEWTRLCALEPR